MYATTQPSAGNPRMDAKRMFQRVLTGWASDVLALRRNGWDRPCERPIDAAFGLTFGSIGVGSAPKSGGRRKAA